MDYLEHLRYTAWASRKLVDAAAQLTEEELNRDFGTADKSVLGTLVHVYAADRIWLARIEGREQQFITPEDRNLAVLQNDWPKLLERWQSLSDFERAISYKDLKGNSYQTPLRQIILHVVNHGTHHRGQVSGFLRAMGHKPPPVDLIFFYRE